MGLSTNRRKFAAVGLAALAVLASATACSKDKDSSSGGSNESIELNVDVFGDQGFGYEDLYTEYKKTHPNITIKERGKGLGLTDYNNRLTQWMASGTGAGDVIALEEGTIVQYKAQADNFVNLLDYNAASVKSNFFSWKWEQGATSDGKKVIGVGTDVGSMAMCYRTDLFKEANLPTARDEVGKLWPTWDAYIETGKKFAAANTKAKFVDSSTNLFNTILMQTAGNGSGYTYFDKSDKLAIDSNGDIKTAWDLTVKMIDANLSGGFRSFSDDWNAAFKQASFATIACPAWMTGNIKGQAGDAGNGKWDIAKAPGNGGNWGGSFLAVPKQSKHAKEAAELALFLTSKTGQIAAFNKIGALPSNPEAIKDTAVQSAKNDYFSGAPTGQIFGAGAAELKPVYLGSLNQAVRDEVENALRSVEQKQRSSADGWSDAKKNGAAAAKK